MAKGPNVIGVITEVPKPSWWKRNRHRVLLGVGLMIGYFIGTHGADASPNNQIPPVPSRTAPDTPAPTTRPS